LSEAATGIYDFVHVLHDGFLGNIVLENDCVACKTA
jgi:hypothetical protein